MIFRRSRQSWRRFRAQKNTSKKISTRNIRQDKLVMSKPESVEFECDYADFFDCGESFITSKIQRRPKVNNLDRRINTYKHQFEITHDATDGYHALLAQFPRAVLAQIQMDRYPRGYQNKQERLFELIDFNDTIVATILAMPDNLRTEFEERVKQAGDRICKRVGAPCFTNEQWVAIIRGLTREVAVYLAAVEGGFDVVMTDRVHDSMGIDMQIRDTNTNKYINIDIKTPSSFRYRLERIARKGKITEREINIANERGYLIVDVGHGARETESILLCILPDRFGDLKSWRFVNPMPMQDMLSMLIDEHGLRDDKFGVRYV